MKMTDETKLKISYTLLALTEATKLTLQVFVALPACYCAYIGLKDMGWAPHTFIYNYVYVASAYLFILIWIELLVIVIGMGIVAGIALIGNNDQ